MSSTQAPASGETVVIILALILLLMVRRVYRSYKGIRFNAGRTLGVVIFYVAFGSFFSIASFFEGVSLLFAAPYALILAAAAAWSYRYSDRRISFWRGGDGSVYFKGGVILYVIYLVGLVARLSIEAIVFGPNLFSFTPGQSLSGETLYAIIATDLLLMFGLGLLVGRNVRVFKRYKRIEEGKEVLPDSPPAYQSIFGSRKEEDPGAIQA